MSKTVTVLSGMIRPLVENQLPDWIEPRFFMSKQEAMELAPGAEIGWFDMYDKKDMAAAITAATRLKWLNSIYAGVDGMPLALLKERGVVVTNGAGINAITIAEYVVMGMLTVAKGYRDVVRAQDRREWLTDSPGKVELYGSKALLLGYGAIGRLVEERLKGFAVDVTVVRRSPGANSLSPDQWRARLGEFDWVILAVPATAETEGMVGAAELAAMKPSATLINIARGSVVDQDALVTALNEQQIASAFLDVTTPEPLPPDDPLWSLDNAHITMHLSGRAQDKMFARSAQRFLDNLDRWQRGEPVTPQVDLTLGY
ncbi:D-2-hydroxyacid dehydrogenase [Sphingopyxis sp. 113P3]|jgi:Phosphoglycerate dehydrogenase and related dehydrogenases|uniref:D-2-hydroxyacid dehydrogenase n=1 Tax=Sphingopyxis sp. (strain 113P3) TaxID=292913 RepID=UPI0006AD3F2A|nr:D-2-hydroxyacid dehydrogenase [Sphingopyxis sp. 113P3]ALC10971.1 dehydrogenase [Sphingopyxis sp. 113P3]